MKLAALILTAAFLDALTMLLLPPGSEQNPIASFVPLVAVGMKVCLALLLALAAAHGVRYFRAVGAFCVVAWSVGFAANVAVLW